MIFNIKIKDNDDNIIENINSIINYNDKSIPEIPKEIYGFNVKLNIYRDKIDKINTDVWKKIRWYINDYDFLVKDPIINRAFYKYWEIISVFNIFENYNQDEDKIFHCAEAPGGFIQGSNIYLQLNNTKILKDENLPDKDGFVTVYKKKKRMLNKYKIYTISLNKDLPEYKNYNLPSYNNNVINKNVCITYGKDNTGNINNLDNIEHIKTMVQPDGCYLVTADGGFDEGNDFNNKEQLHYLLILNEIYSAICLQKSKGNFILKVFDIFTDTSINLLYLLNLIYSEVYIYKPKTSRPTNSEKYIICKNFKLKDNIKLMLLDKLNNLSSNLKLETHKYNSFKLFNKIPDLFIENIYQMNTFVVDKQCEHLSKAIELCQDSVFMENYEVELEKSLHNRRNIFKQWKSKYKLNY
jgi:23S rRNA U2552 (ribose-2'-O)-methylase RlmE/FtsJ